MGGGAGGAVGAAQVQARARRQEAIEALTAATMRALSGRRELHYRARRVFHGARPLPRWAPHLQPPLESTSDFTVFRGAADGIALRLLLSDAALHQRLLGQAAAAGAQAEGTSHPAARMLFEVFEQLRVEALAIRTLAMPGLAHNLSRCFEAWSLNYHAAGHTATARGLLVYCIVQMVRARLTGEPAVEPDEGLLEATRASLGPALGVPLAGLRRKLHHQAAFAAHAWAIARHVAHMLASADEEEGDGAGLNADGDDVEGDEDEDRRHVAFNFWIEPPDAGFEEERAALAASGTSLLLATSGERYRIFTTAYDREAPATALARAAQLQDLRAELDARIEAARLNLAHLARDLRALLARPAVEGWQGAMEEGRIDGARLAQLVASPTERRLFRSERIEPRASDTLLTLLIDCSGSMREHAPHVAVLADVLARALEMAGVPCEVLGFTTSAWSGGRAARDWQRAGRPRHPGRLNEALHIVFKAAHTPWRRARPAMAALLKADLFREGLDGEAVQWALARQAAWAQEQPPGADAMSAGFARRLLLVVSDGSPMDSATHQANDRHYLDHHLREVVARAEASASAGLDASTRIFGLGVGLDLSPYYARSHVLDLASGGVGMGAFREVMGMLGRVGWR
ncbi:MAG: cobalt chelatase [Rubrivivax sp.]|nr:cobalt chelatase [Rubrivivax sp.]